MTTALTPKLAYPRPPVDFRPEGLFREPVYADGPYDQGDEDEDLED
ncbi:hypothetical protein [Streptomyces sp. NBC_01483]|nr:hypothetical protein [Streptomyces sp. NBC_01483]